MAKQQKPVSENVDPNEVETSLQNTGNSISENVAQASPKMKTLISGAEYWRFSDEVDEKTGAVVRQADGPVFEGYFIDLVKREKDGPKAATDENHKAGAVIGYTFKDANSDMLYIIGKSHSVHKALETSGFKTDKMYRFEFLGKGMTATKQPFNRFEIAVEE